jgi:PEP-CTERM motif
MCGLGAGGIADMKSIHRTILARALMSTGLSLALMTAGAAGVRAEDVTVVGANGANGASGVNPGDPGQPGGDAESAVANAGSAYPLNKAMATGGSGGAGGGEGGFFPPFPVQGAPGGRGGDANASAGTVSLGSGEADAISVGGGGSFGAGFDGGGARGADGGSASSLATSSSANGNATVSATATGGSGGISYTFGGSGGDADASSMASTNGSGNASSSATATGGAGGDGDDNNGGVGNATAMADASAAGGGTAIATAVATQGFPSNHGAFPNPRLAAANATSSAETTNGARAEALSTGGGAIGETQSTAKTSLGDVSVQSTIMAPSIYPFLFGQAMTTEAIAQGGSAPTLGGSGAEAYAISTVLPDDDSASNFAALTGRRVQIFGTASQWGIAGTATTTFDFSFRGDLLLSVEGFDFDVIVNGVDIFAAGYPLGPVIDLGSSFGPDIDLTFTGFGDFVVGGVVPEPSTWAMMLFGFAGLGYAGHRARRSAIAA